MAKSGLILATAMAASASLASPASAATFDFTSDTKYSVASETFSEDGIDLVVESVGSAGTDLHFNFNGIGVKGGKGNNRLAGDAEAVLFTFDPPVSILNSVVFEIGNGLDIVDIYNGSGTLLTSFVVPSADDSQTFHTEFFNGLVGSTFKFVSTANADKAGIRITSLDVVATPLPGALWLMFSGLAGFIGWKRHARKKAITA